MSWREDPQHEADAGLCLAHHPEEEVICQRDYRHSDEAHKGRDPEGVEFVWRS